MPLNRPNQKFVPFRFRRHGRIVDLGQGESPWNGWISIQLVRRWTAARSRTMWQLGAPILAVAPVVELPPPPAIYLQAVNRAGSF